MRVGMADASESRTQAVTVDLPELKIEGGDDDHNQEPPVLDRPSQLRRDLKFASGPAAGSHKLQPEDLRRPKLGRAESVQKIGRPARQGRGLLFADTRAQQKYLQRYTVTVQ